MVNSYFILYHIIKKQIKMKILLDNFKAIARNKPTATYLFTVGYGNWLPGEDSNLGPSGYDLTCISARVGLSLHPKISGWRV